jgi:hypothetical protein
MSPLVICQRCLACLWAAAGLCVVFLALRHLETADLSNAVALVVGLALALGASGLFFNTRWGRISVGCLLGW